MMATVSYLESQIMIARSNRRGVTILELLVVISIATLLVSLLLTGVQAARERARNVACINQLRQIGLGIQSFESAHRQYPSDGWGWAWVGDDSANLSLDGPGGWIHNILPFIEQQSLWEATKSLASRNQAIQTPVPILYCPSRRSAAAYPYTQTSVPLRNADTPKFGSRTDYAICAGSRVISVGPGPDTIEDLATFPRIPKLFYSGISFVRSQIGTRDITDGLSHTMAVSEKSIASVYYETGESLGDDQTVLLGDDADIRRWTQFFPLQDSLVDDIERFGSAHPTGINTVLCDGSISFESYSIDGLVWQRLGNHNDGGAKLP